MKFLDVAKRYTQSLGILSYAFTQWFFLFYFTHYAGLEGAGHFSLAQAVCTPAFAMFAFSLRQWWVAGLFPNLSKTAFVAIRVATSIFALATSIALIKLLDGSTASSIFLLVLVLKFFESISDAAYAALDASGLSTEAGLLLISKATVLSGIALIAVLLSYDPRTLLIAVVFSGTIIMAIELYVIWPLSARELCQLSLKNLTPTVFRFLFFTSCSSLIVAIQGYLPRYAIEFFDTKATLGYFTLLSMPLSIMTMVVTGLCQSHLLNYRQQLASGKHLQRLTDGLRSVRFLFFFIFFVIAILLLLSVTIGAATLYGFSRVDLFYCGIVLLLGVPLICAQFLSYFISPLGRPGSRLAVNVASLLGASLSIVAFLYLDPVISAGLVIAIGGILQCIGFAFLLFSSSRGQSV